MENLFLYLVVGLLACFIGTIPFGPINLTVVKITVDFNQRHGTEVALAASIVEVFEALVAICFGLVISTYLESNIVIKLIIAAVFICLAGIVFTKKTDLALRDAGKEEQSFFKKGLLVATLNPQAIPFWIFALAAISQYFEFQYIGIYLIAFLSGVFIGKFFALYGFVIASGYLKTHLKESSQLVNRTLAGILFFIGISQAWNAIGSLVLQ
ncbi:MAG: LysE family transporter [Gammaproteobacteria bacterium]|nr:LysE family transporter [Gammaproteobacteria bacterium]MDD9958840.1 LysE family transporter [Gammaproteobacteria bacterium]